MVYGRTYSTLLLTSISAVDFELRYFIFYKFEIHLTAKSNYVI